MVEKGFAWTNTNGTLKDDIYVIVFNQKGLMEGLGIKGSKISRIYPEK